LQSIRRPAQSHRDYPICLFLSFILLLLLKEINSSVVVAAVATTIGYNDKVQKRENEREMAIYLSVRES
jgi:hypothetical protein